MNDGSVALDGIVVRHPQARPEQAAALRGVDLHVRPGEQLAVIGPSGAGKTSLLLALARALRVEQGRLRVGGADPWTLKGAALRRLRGTVFLAPQVPPLPPRQRTVTAVLAARLPTMSLAHSLWSLLHPAQATQAFDALSRFDLGEKLWERVDRLSGGERQRVGLARALVSPARLWLIDEPLSALDPARATQALRSLTGAARERGATLIATLHQVDLALAHFPRVLGLRDGQVAFDLPSARVDRARLAALYAQHEHEWMATPHAASPPPPSAGAPTADPSASLVATPRC